MRDYRDAKAMAQTLRQALNERSVSLTHSESLELIAKVLGLADWNVLAARIAAAPAMTGPQKAPALRLPVLPLRDLVLFPHMTTPLFVMRPKSLAAIERAMAADKQIVFVTQREAATDHPGGEQLHTVGVIGSPVQMSKQPDGSVRMLVTATRRARLSAIGPEKDCVVAEVVPLLDEGAVRPEASAVSDELLKMFAARTNISLATPPQALAHLTRIKDPGGIADSVAQHLSLSIEQCQDILQTVDVIERIRKVMAMMGPNRQAA